jgi:hypothetical protein
VIRGQGGWYDYTVLELTTLGLPLDDIRGVELYGISVVYGAP